MIDFLNDHIAELAVKFEEALAAGSFAIFSIVFSAGVLSSLLPCVYPVIPLTVSYLGAAAAETRFRAFLLSLMYVLGMSGTYALLCAAFFVAKDVFASKAVFGSWVAHPVLFIFLGGLYLVLALWMLDVFHLTLAPGRRASGRKPTGLPGAFLVGMSAGLVLGPCTGPVLAGVIGVALREHSIWGAMLLTVTYSLGLGVLFLLIGTFSALATYRPKPGRWMVVLKNAFAVALLVVACGLLVHAGVLWERRTAKTDVVPTRSANSNIALTVVTPDERVHLGSKIPQMTVPVLFKTPNGWETRAFDSTEISRPVVLVFWAIRCEACIEEIPLVSSVWKAFGDRIELIAVNNSENLTVGHLEDLEIDYPVAFDTESELSYACGVDTLPWMIITNRKGVIRYFDVVPPADFERYLEEILKEEG